MKDNPTQNDKATANTAEAEERKEVAADLGKFKDVQALMQAYEALEAEFTRRSQRLKELEESKERQTPAQTENAEVPSPEAKGAETLSEEMKKAVIEEYLSGVCANRGVPIITGGGAVSAVRRTASTLSEANALARKLFDKKEEN